MRKILIFLFSLFTFFLLSQTALAISPSDITLTLINFGPSTAVFEANVATTAGLSSNCFVYIFSEANLPPDPNEGDFLQDGDGDVNEGDCLGGSSYTVNTVVLGAPFAIEWSSPAYAVVITTDDSINYWRASNVVTFNQPTGSGGPVVHTPIVELLSPLTGGVFTGSLEIKYKASDLDQGLYLDKHSIGPNPVDIFYSSDDGKNWVLIAEEQPAERVFNWDIANLPDGQYKIRLTVTGVDNDFGQKISESFTLDNTPPHFSIETIPSFTKGEPVTLEVVASEELQTIPELFVTQFNHDSVIVEFDGEGINFSGTYNVIEGFDGPARISITGQDKAGNAGKNIISGDTFAVGIEPPPAPTIVTPQKGERFNASPITVRGEAVNAQKVIVRVNGTVEFVSTDIEGNQFIVESVELDPKFNNGIYSLSVVVKDELGRFS